MGVLPPVSEVKFRGGDYSTICTDLSSPHRAQRANKPRMAVKTTNKSKRPGRNKPSRNSSLPTLALLCIAVLLFSASCGGEHPAPPVDTPIREGLTETPAPSPTPATPVNPSPTPVPTPTMSPAPGVPGIATHAATEASNTEGDSDEATKTAVQQLFDNWTRALIDADAALFHSILTRELADSCGLDDLQSWLDQDEASAGEFLMEAEVAAVFLDVADPRRAFAELSAGQRLRRTEESILFPWPVALEDGEWRAGFPTALPALKCPYVGSSSPSGPSDDGREYPQIPGLDLERREDIFAAVPGTRVVRGSIRGGDTGSGFSSGGSMSPYDNNVNIYGELETESTAGQVALLYRDGLIHPTWDITGEGSSDDFAWFSWSVPDAEGRLWHGSLVVAPLHEGWKQVWLSLYADDADNSR